VLGDLLARVLVRGLREIATLVRQVERRGGRVYIDYLQNGRGKLLVAPYCVRPLPGAPVSTPLRWSEVKPGLDIRRFTIRTMPRRVLRDRGPATAGPGTEERGGHACSVRVRGARVRGAAAVRGRQVDGRADDVAGTGGRAAAARRGARLPRLPIAPAGRGIDGPCRAPRRVGLPMLFLQGTRDTLADLDLMRGVCDGLGPRATLHVVDGADHGFHVLKRSGRTDDDVLSELADTVTAWLPR
jgi:predicted alpha/beta-hydrolase family hydrolase